MNPIPFFDVVETVLSVSMVVIFVSIFAWAYWPGHKKRFEADAQIPLRDGE